MNYKKLALTSLAAFATIWLTDCVFHGYLMESTYKATAHLWRAEAEMKSCFMMMILGQLLMGVFGTMIFVHGYKNTGWKEGVRFGILLGGLNLGNLLIMHVVAPYPVRLTASWIAFGFVQWVIVGVVAACVYSSSKT